MTRPRRPEPKNFDVRVDRLIELEKIIEESEREYDEIIISLLVIDRAPSATIAERMNMIPQAVTHLRKRALKRRRVEVVPTAA